MENFLNKIRRKPIRTEAKWGCQQKGSFSEEKNDELTYPIPGARVIASRLNMKIPPLEVIIAEIHTSRGR
ncbi:MAG: hypothetical protein E6276_06140 [Clostridiales bacterium]|nr:hypothetical protein [Clostridiales bacterium]